MTLRRVLPVAAAVIAAVALLGGRAGPELLRPETPPEPPRVLPMPARPAPNPFAAPSAYALPGHDPARTGVLPIPVSRGTFRARLHEIVRLEPPPGSPGSPGSPAVPAVPAVPLPLAASPERLWAVSPSGVAWLDTADGGLRELARIEAGGGPDLLDVVAGADGVLVASRGTSLVAYGPDPAGVPRVLRSLDLADALEGPEREGGLRTGLTYDGHLVVLAGHSLRVVDRDLTHVSNVVRFGDGERAAAGVAVDERNGVWIATDRALRRIAWTGSALSTDPEDGAWEVGLDGKPGQVGSAPALMGFGDDPDKLVVVADGASPPRLVAFWREAVPKGAKKVPGARTTRLAGRVELTGAPGTAGSPSLAVLGYGAVVVAAPTGVGEARSAAVERLAWDPDTDAWRSLWVRDGVPSTGAEPAVSGPSQLVFVHGCTPGDGYALTGLDWETGRTEHTTLLGRDELGAHGGAPIRFLPDGDLLLDGVGGPIRASCHVVEAAG